MPSSSVGVSFERSRNVHPDFVLILISIVEILGPPFDFVYIFLFFACVGNIYLGTSEIAALHV